MKNEAYLVGTYREKREINRLMDLAPTFIHHDYISLCTALLEYLYIGGIEDLSDFDYELDGFIDYMELDLNERLLGLKPNLTPYLEGVRRALQFFRGYLDILDWIPLPANVQISRCNNESVMILRTVNKRPHSKRK